MTKVGLFAVLILLVTSVDGTNVSRLQSQNQSASENSTIQLASSSKVAVPLNEIDLAKIGHIAPKGRVQDKDYNELPIVDQLIAMGTDSIPFLIVKLEDDTKINGPVMDYWSEMRVGDVAHIILNNFFLDSSWKKTTIPGVGWGEFLGCKNVGYFTAEQCLRNYIARSGRQGLKAKWQRVWDVNKDRMYWDEADRSFRLKAS